MGNVNEKLIKVVKLIEIFIAVLLLIAIIASTLQATFGAGKQLFEQTFSLSALLANVLSLVVGVEFVKMLLLHTPDSVIEVLLYAVARQIIISHDSALENLIGVLAVAIIFIIKKYFLDTIIQKEKN
ncbi:MAG: transporter [Longicatena sp.]